jgi:hypothetical protein
MTIAQKHDVLSAAAGNWLLRAVDPFAISSQVGDAPDASEVPRLIKAAKLHGVLPKRLVVQLGFMLAEEAYRGQKDYFRRRDQ